LMLWKLKSHN